ncbi:hypothetical protein GNF76_22915 [Pseudomonas sp. CCM 7893]|uniref:Pectate lyase superfamily protein domain-containing protein n=1 Tax=Pseudomonas spelaei TaxID=1055469 RepID=A0A6I3WAD6_9PSED|nr:hypothetical protein [Pseudomonas spelaei]MUF07207.1 hypothetical protein [Pseudomonas spelaei]
MTIGEFTQPAEIIPPVKGLIDPNQGASLIPFVPRGTSSVLSTVESALRRSVHADDYCLPGLVDNTDGLANAVAALGSLGGTVVLGARTYVASTLVIPRGVIIQGENPLVSILQQQAGSNVDFVTSENFASLTGTGLPVATDSRVPSWFGLRNIQVNGNRENNSTGRACCFYGAYTIIDHVVIGWGASGGLYTEYATNVSSNASVADQEEGFIRDLIVRDNNGDGWVNRGPHNVHMDNITGMRNEGWNYFSEILDGTYNGAPTYCTILHCFQGDMSWTSASGRKRKNIYIGTNGSFGQITVDGGSLEINAGSCLISNLNQYFGGQGGDMVTVSGSRNMIGVWRGLARAAGSTATPDAWVAKITGDFNSVGVMQIYDNSEAAAFSNGVLVSGVGTAIADLFIRGTKTGLKVTSSRNRIRGWVANTLVSGFEYTTPVDSHGGRNRINLDISPSSGAYTTGNAPIANSDRFNIEGTGLSGGTKSTTLSKEQSSIAGDLDTVGVKTLVIPHGLLYAPRRQDIKPSLTGLTVKTLDLGFIRCSVVDATNITIEYRVVTPAVGGVMSIAVQTAAQ